MSFPDDLQAIADAAKAGASFEECEAMAEKAFGFPFEIPHIERRIRARVAFLLVINNGGTKEEAKAALSRIYFPHTPAVAKKIATGNAGGPVNQEARLRFAAMSDEQRERTSTRLEVTSTRLEVSRSRPAD